MGKKESWPKGTHDSVLCPSLPQPLQKCKLKVETILSKEPKKTCKGTNNKPLQLLDRGGLPLGLWLINRPDADRSADHHGNVSNHPGVVIDVQEAGQNLPIKARTKDEKTEC